MTVFRKNALLSNHSLLKLTLVHAAFVDSYPVHDRGGKLPVNRLLFVHGGDARHDSRIRDPADGRTYPMRAGNLYFIPCNRPVDMDLAPDLQFLSLQFRLDLIYGFDVMEDCPHCARLPVPELVDELAGLLASEAELPTLLRVNEILFGLCVRLLPRDGKALRERLARGREFRKALDYVRTEADAGTTVGTLAALSGMRQDVFSRRFTRSLGLSPKEFLSDTVARKASELLLVPGNSVKDVARILNFSSPYYFSHFFRRRTGQAPLQFRRLNGLE
ncbi:MAG: AraC family transcriptional regulator [Lentisphaeria bacterium]|nr:AraC family transcriptional regulator [Lentisphaeria bacterium]